MKKFGVVGSPVLHSLSPSLFKAAYNGAYPYIRLMAQTPAEALILFDELNLDGINITSPFKSVNGWGNGIQSSDVKILGVMNTIVKDGNNLHFYNTDINGINSQLPDVKGVKCLILGAGGAAIAAAYTLIKKGGEVIIANRTLSKAQYVAQKLGCNYCSLNDIPHTKIVVNTLKIRMIEPTEEQFLIDAIYHNSPYGKANISGLDWLVGQAVAAYRIFTSKEPDIEAMRLINNDIPTTLHFVGERSEEVTKLFPPHLIDKNGMMIWLYDGKSNYINIAWAVIDARLKSKEEIYEEICKAL